MLSDAKRAEIFDLYTAVNNYRNIRFSGVKIFLFVLRAQNLVTISAD